MDQEELQRQIAKHYEKLPPEAQRIFSSMNWLQTLNALSIKYSLSDEKKEILGTETMLVLLGIIHVEDYEDILTKQIALPRNSMDEMIIEINDLILKTIRPQITEAFYKNNQESSVNVTEENILVEEGLKEQKIDDRFASLSDEAKDAIVKSNYRAKLYEIAKGNQLSVIQMGVLENVFVDVVLDKIHPDKFENTLAEQLQVPTEKCRAIVNEVNEKILKDIRSSLMSLSVKKQGLENEPKEDIQPEVLSETIKEMAQNKSVLEKAGIEMLGEKKTVAENQNKGIANEAIEKHIDRNDLLNKVENPSTLVVPPLTPSLSAQKLSGAFRVPEVKTEHTLENISKNTDIPPTKNVPVPPPPPTPPAPTAPRIDPYREMPQ